MTRCRPILGTFVEIDCDRPENIDCGFAAIEQVHRSMSAHMSDSELAMLNRDLGTREKPVRLSPDLMAVLGRAQYWAEASDGSFDPVAAGRMAIERGDVPLHDGQQPPDPESDFRCLHLAEDGAWLDRLAAIDLGGIAKGHAVDCAVAAMRKAGAEAGIVNAGGDLFVFGPAREIAIEDPETGRPRLTVSLSDHALATSAGRRTGAGALGFDHLPVHGRRYSSVSVTAPRAIDADALTKIVLSGHRRTADLLGLVGARALGQCADGAIVDIGREAD